MKAERASSTRLDRLLELLHGRQFIDVELSALCNLDCKVCPRDRISRQQGIMDQRTIALAAAFAPEGSRVAFSGLGEPLLNPLAESAVEAFKERGARVGMVTNATLLDADRARALIDSGLDFIELSWPLHADDPQAASTAKRNMEGFAALRPREIKAYLSIATRDAFCPELDEARAFAFKNRFTTLARRVHSRGGGLYEPPLQDLGPCGLFAAATFVAWDGYILSCCNDLAGESRLCSVADSDFESLQLSKEKMIRAHDIFPFCAGCDDPHRKSLLDRSPPAGI